MPRPLLPALIAGVLLIYVAPAAHAEDPYIVRSWTPNDGLPTSTVNDVVQTPDGYLWVATTGGLARFDGVRFEIFGTRDGLPSSRFDALLVARDSTLYGVTEDGWLVHWDGSRFTSVDTHRGMDRSSLVGAPDGTVWGTGANRLWRFRDGIAHAYPDSLEFFAPLVVDGDGALWLTLRGQIPARVRGDRIEPIGPGAPGIGHWIPDRRSGRPLLFREHGRDAELFDTALRHVVTLPGAGVDWPQEIDPRGRLWATSGSDVVVRALDDGHEVQRYRLGLTERASRVYLDAGGNAWVCTETQGLLRVAPSPLRLFRPAGMAAAIEILFARERDDGSVIATDLSMKAWRVGEATLLQTPGAPYANGGDEVLSVAGTTRYRVGSNVLEIRDPVGRRVVGRVPGILAFDVVEDPSRPGALIASYDDAVERFSVEDGAIRITPLFHPRQEIRHLFVDRQRRLWVATMFGLWRVTPGDTTVFTRKDGLPVDHIRQIHEDRDGTMWFGTYGGGLVRWKDGRFATLDRRHGLLEDVVSVVLEDDDGDLWLAGNRGIQHFSRQQANQVLDGKRARVDVVGLAADAGLRNPEGSGRPGLRTRDGRLWFPTFDGLAVVDPRLARALAGKPPVPHIAGVSVGDRALARGPRGFVVPAGDGRFDVRFTGFDLRAAEQLRFSYRLDGVDHDWSEAVSGRTASYAHVPPGRHTFRLVAYSGTGRASDREDTVTIEVRPRFWQTRWFLALAVLAGVFAIAAGWRVRDRRLLARAVELQRAVDARTAELGEEKARTEAQSERLAALDRSRSRFFASISHEFRTPLTLIHGPLHDVRAGVHGPVTSEAGQQVDLALDSVGRLHRLVDQLLDAARAEAGELRIERKPRDLVAFLDRLAQAFVPLAERKQIAFSRRLPAGPLVAAFDTEALEKVFANLLGNAFKFTPGGGHVMLSAEAALGGTTPAIEIAVTDDGPGIAAEDLPHVFKRFYRAERSVTRVQPGTGLGLTLAADMVEQHEGTIRVESREGHGSTFTVRLALLAPGEVPESVSDESPAVDAAMVAALADEIRVVPKPATDAELEPTPARESGPLILVVEDHPDVRAYVARHLRRRYRVTEAADGAQALAAMRAELPDLVVSDVNMPEMDGNQLVRAIREDAELDFVPVLLLTAAASPDHRVAGLEGGADDYLTKPFEMRELLARVAQALESRQRLRNRIARAAAAASVYGVGPGGEDGGTVAAPVAGNGAPEAIAAPSTPIAAGRVAAMDSAFARRMREVIESRMGDEDFDVDRLAEAMGMGRSTFFETVSQTMEQTPMTLVMTYRLDRAAQMLRASEGNVGEVAYAVGFRSVSHFTRRFREHHGVTPSACRRGVASWDGAGETTAEMRPREAAE